MRYPPTFVFEQPLFKFEASNCRNNINNTARLHDLDLRRVDWRMCIPII
jgi:hypothetical protein